MAASEPITIQNTSVMSANKLIMNHRVRARKIRGLRDMGYWLGKQFYNKHGLQHEAKVRIDIYVTRPKRGGLHDVANYAPTAKALVDGIVDSGVIDNDDNAHLDGPFLHDAGRDHQLMIATRFLITITPVER